MKLLLITHPFPYPPIDGFSQRVYNLILRIAKEHEVWLFSCSASRVETENITHLQKFCKDVMFVPSVDYRAWEKPLEFIQYLIHGVPPELRFYYSQEINQALMDFTQGKHFDIIQIDDSFMAQYYEFLPKNISRKYVLTFHDVDYMKAERIYQIEKKLRRKIRLWLRSRMMRNWEPFYAERFDLCITMSELDRAILRQANPRLHVEVIPNGVDTKKMQMLPFFNDEPPAVLFVGSMGYIPNIDAVSYFTKEILPIIRRQISQTEFWIVGIEPDEKVKQLEGNGVHVTGKVDDIRPYYQRCQVAVIPLRAGSGTRLKILESMALGRAVVSTSIGCEGLDVTDGENILIADDSNLFAEKVVMLLKMNEFRRNIVSAAREMVVNTYDWDILARKTLTLYSKLFLDLSSSHQDNGYQL